MVQPLQDDVLLDLLATALSVTVQEDRLEEFETEVCETCFACLFGFGPVIM